MIAHSQTGLGVLSVIPLEIRCLVYYHVFVDRYCYSAQPGSSIGLLGLLGTSRALRDEATHTLYSHSKFQIGYIHKPGEQENNASSSYISNVQPDFGKNPGLRWQELGPSQEVIKHLDHVEIAIDMHDYSVEYYPGAIPDAAKFYEDLLRKIACIARVRKTCRIIIRNTGSIYGILDEYADIPDLRNMSKFRTVSIEIEGEAIEFEDFGTVDRGPVDLLFDEEDDFRGSACHVRMVSAKELTIERLRTHLRETLGDGVYDKRRNFRCLTFHPQSTQVRTSHHTRLSDV